MSWQLERNGTQKPRLEILRPHTQHSAQISETAAENQKGASPKGGPGVRVAQVSDYERKSLSVRSM